MSGYSVFHWISASRSEAGRVRSINEDACVEVPDRGIWAVADGMGGHSVGDYASREVAAGLAGIAAVGSLADAMIDARQRLLVVNAHLQSEALKRNVRMIGSTVVVMLARDRYCGWLWAGDSRLYRYRQDRLSLLTRDHSQLEEFNARLQSGAGDELPRPARNVITRAVGATADLILDQQAGEVRDGDIYLLCSDGLNKELSDDEIGGVLAGGDCARAVEQLIDGALAHGGRDNISVIVARAEDAYGSEKTLFNPEI